MRYFAIAVLLILTGCSTVIEGRSQEIMVNTRPVGAKCDFKRNDEIIATIAKTPGSAYIKKTKDDIVITCDKKGYETTTFINHSGAAGATFGNIVAGGVIGWGVDSAVGADNKYDSPVSIELNKK